MKLMTAALTTLSCAAIALSAQSKNSQSTFDIAAYNDLNQQKSAIINTKSEQAKRLATLDSFKSDTILDSFKSDTILDSFKSDTILDSFKSDTILGSSEIGL